MGHRRRHKENASKITPKFISERIGLILLYGTFGLLMFGPLAFGAVEPWSSFVVETSNRGPISCRASICDNARKTWDEDNRRIEFGSSPAMIHLSTVNGPVSVQSPREEM